MAKHRMQPQPSRGATAARGALAAGAITLGTLAVPAANAMAAPATGSHEAHKPVVKKAKKAPVKKVAKKVAPKKTVKTVKKASKPLVQSASIAPKTIEVHAGGAKAQAVQTALSKTGMPYSYGSAGPNAFDCSGLVYYSMKSAGISVPRDSWGQLGGGTPVSLSNLQPGDVIIYNGGSHAGLYIGNGKVVQAINYGIPVKVTPLDNMKVYAARRY
ncbi:C40 family peptidase [Tsukamurella sp. 8F]|uniref:C40 family peptidase n=1 Tax=unclassified Tsukamurella TaxID=2633480 RepID=UPI0023B992E6|nr:MULTISPECIES: C40 family peptidase [unclassified Tsukamurella]MDF0532008.1 C40 family peptidase [Tsukamurella sp. 8J]MDF0588413.1 C40 family peptidase [Tsukamurella sp. 8F]